MSAEGTVAEDGTVVVIGGGVGGLCAAIQAAAAGCPVTLLERGSKVGGKMRELGAGERPVDAGPTVLTMRWAFEQLFEAADRQLGDYVELEPLTILARHAWPDGGQLDLFADPSRSAEAIAAFAGPEEAAGFRRFCAHTEMILEIVEQPFLRSTRPSASSIVTAMGLRGALAFLRCDWHRTMWTALSSFFADPRLRQLFGRYATYYGSSPFQAPATINLIAQVEQRGVWRVVGGMYRLAEALARLAEELGVEIRTGREVAEIRVDPETGRAAGVRCSDGEVLEAAAVIVNAAPQALDEGRFGRDLRGCVGLRSQPRSLSAVTWTGKFRAEGFALAHHNVFFSSDYPEEFRALARGELPDEPTVYVCAQDRHDHDHDDDDAEGHASDDPARAERMLILVNAPARGDEDEPWTAAELDELEARSFALMRSCGLELAAEGEVIRTEPRDFEALFPATGGALYGFATHSMMAPFHRPGAQTEVPGLFLAGGGAHPGAGVPMVCLSGQLAGRAAAESLARRERS